MADWTTIRLRPKVRDRLNHTGNKGETHNDLIVRLLNQSLDMEVRIIILELMNLSRNHHEQFGGMCIEPCPYPRVIAKAEGLLKEESI